MRETGRRWVALAAAAAMVWSCLPPVRGAEPARDGAAAQTRTVITVATAEDLTALSRSCALDTWSRDKTVVLTADIDLLGAEFAPIPTFGGIFLGEGHSISGLNLTGSGSVRGLFRYLQPGASVQGLTVKGSVYPGRRQDTLGLLAGSNAGRVVGCEAVGSVTGETAVGGLVGRNEAGGELVNCRFSGRVTGKRAAGGIAGENRGSLVGCVNRGDVNRENLEDAGRTDYTNLAQFSAEALLPPYSDTGGIAGFSDGSIQSCRNLGAVGYEQRGVNIGGIAGRSGGWVDGCGNEGSVRGRQDVGGIVGQLQPEVVRTYSQDFVEKLLDELDRLGDATEAALRHGDAAVSALGADLEALHRQARDTKAAAAAFGGALTEWIDGSVETVNTLSARIARTLEQVKASLEEARELTRQLEALLRAMERVRLALRDAAAEGTLAAADFQRAMEALQAAGGVLEAALPEIEAALEKVGAALDGGSEAQLRQALTELAAALGTLSDAVPPLQEALGQARSALGHLEAMGEDVKAALDRLEEVNRAAGNVLAALERINDTLLALTKELTGEPPLTLTPIGPALTEPAAALSDALDALLDGSEALSRTLERWSAQLVADLRDVNRQLRRIVELIRTERDSLTQDAGKSREERIAAHFQDASEACTPDNQHQGRVSASENRGTVEAASGAGGIVGAVAIDTDLDGTDDLTHLGEYSLAYYYQMRALVYGCVNTAAVTARKDTAGGIAGQVDAGLVDACENYGDVTAEEDFAGGIAGRSTGTIRRCWAKAHLRGRDYVGGIAGRASAAEDCRSLAEVTGESCTGAVLGGMDGAARLSGNRFTHESLGGVDGISYAGGAEPVDFAALQEGAPRRFSRLELTFMAEGKTVAVRAFQYGGGIASLPEVPVKAGHFAAWPDMDYTRLTASGTVEAVYTPYATALAEEGDGPPQVVLSGSFGGRARVERTEAPVTWTDARGRIRSAQAVTVTVTDPDFQDVAYTVHYRLPAGDRRWRVYLETPEGFRESESRRDGQYLLIPAEGESVTFCVVERERAAWTLPAAMGALALAQLAGWTLRRRGRRKGCGVSGR